MPEHSLLDLATAVTGRPVDMDRVQITDQEAFRPLSDLYMEAASRDVAAGREPSPPELTGFAQDDGRLVVRATLAGGVGRIFEVPAEKWVELDAETYARLEAEVDPNLGSISGQNLEGLAEVLQGNADAMRDRSAMATSTSRLAIFDRSPQALHSAKEISTEYRALAKEFDRWLAGRAPYLVLFVHAGTLQMGVAEVERLEDLTGPGLPYFAENFGDTLPNAVLTAHWLPPADRTRLNERWRELGGWVPALN